jgi:hypothetical protein
LSGHYAGLGAAAAVMILADAALVYQVATKGLPGTTLARTNP